MFALYINVWIDDCVMVWLEIYWDFVQLCTRHFDSCSVLAMFSLVLKSKSSCLYFYFILTVHCTTLSIMGHE